MQQSVNARAIAHEDRLGLFVLDGRAEQAGPAGGQAGLHAVGEEVGEDLVRVDRTVVANLLRELAGFFGELPDALRQLRGLLLHLGALEALDLDLLLGLGEILVEQLFFLLGHAHGHVEVLDALPGLGVLALGAGEFGGLPLGLGPLLLELALELGQLLLGKEGILGRGGEALLQFLGAVLRRAEGALELALLLLESGEVLFAFGKIALRGSELGGKLLARLLLVLEGDTHQLDHVGVDGRGVGGRARRGGLQLRVRRLRLLPAREREEIEQHEVAHDEEQSLVHDGGLRRSW